jgi:PAS domain S-box-containing protein
VFVANAFVLNRARQHVSEDFGWVVHTLEVQGAIRTVQNDLELFDRSAQMSRLGVASSPVQPSQSETLRHDLDRVQKLTSDNPSQQERFQQLKTLLSQHVSTQAPSLGTIRDTGQLEDRLDQSSRRVAAQLRDMDAEESRLLQQRLDQISSTRKRIDIGLVAETAGSLLVAVVLFGYSSYTRRQGAYRETQFRLLINQLQDYSIANLNESGKIVDCSSSTATLTGRSRADLIGADHALFYTLADRAAGRPKAVLEEALRTGRSEQEVEQLRRDGTTYWANVLVYAVLEPGGKPGFSRVSRDITEHRAFREATEQRAKVSEQLSADTRARLAAIVDSSEDAIIGRDQNGIVRSWNAAAERIFGYSAEEMIGQSLGRLLPADLQDQEVAFLNRINRGEVIDLIETMRKTKDGKLIHVSLTISPIRDAEGNIVGASKIARDITERKKLERQLQQSQKMDAIGQLTGGIAHDFNNLLGVIIGNLSLLGRLVVDNEPAAKRVATAQKAAARGADLTRRLLAFSSSEELNPAPTDLNHAIRNTLELAARTLGPEIKLTPTLESKMPPVFVDAAGLESALLNLAVNARDAMFKGGTLTITSELVTLEDNYAPVKTGEVKPGQYACVSVTDSGTGMSRETLERAFDPFFTTKPRGKGTGLGLAMVYGFVKQSGGTVRLYSELGYGTTVTLYLPLAHDPAKPFVPTVDNHHTATAGAKVLVVDDELDLLEVAFTYLQHMGYTAFQATDGPSALEIFRREPHIDLVITDVIMPGSMNGVELVQQIRQLAPDIKVIYSSGFPADTLSERSGTVVDGLLLHKPYRQSEFNAIVRQTLNGTEDGASRNET